MPLTTQHKLQLLYDLLQNQATERYMSTDEAAQIDRLVTSLAADSSLDPFVKQTISEIQQTHELNHEPFQETEVTQWLNTLITE